ncbi:MULTISPECIES: Crp/Fnr family transcriptional regulator [unclassified Chelatococcus]|uniref:Crp/Fnr family transcriptional regulator n=1 Tax=unclassified Chelatococcus TaxID=2638111 RepID=UPI001BCEE9CA|nr:MULTISPECIES: Crp/Fnr family transcriptional regulator [unclassified Chelatococcus]MBS7698396.1 Crp/Fnr family transcriptional regulator [Chelatococcus sp. YT9]MBX3558837.1 Crp/Fnr family transcriptional regulator [Chelatococcus sp.]
MPELLARTRNGVLSSLSLPEKAVLAPLLETVDLPNKAALELANTPIEHVYFLESGIASTFTVASSRQRAEAGLIGREGLTGLPVLLGMAQAPSETIMQVTGTGFRVRSHDLQVVMRHHEAIRQKLLKFVLAFLIQIGFTALSRSRLKIEGRLARWILMSADRMDDIDLRLTHEFFADLMSVRRASITEAIQMLEYRGLIRAGRQRIVILNRTGLQMLTMGIYGVPEAEYARLFGKSVFDTSLASPAK